MIKRLALLRQVRTALARSRVVALIGPRQCGKTTLARELVEGQSPNYFDLEDPAGLRPGMTGHARVYSGKRPIGAVLLDRALRFLRTEFWW